MVGPMTLDGPMVIEGAWAQCDWMGLRMMEEELWPMASSGPVNWLDGIGLALEWWQWSSVYGIEQAWGHKWSCSLMGLCGPRNSGCSIGPMVSSRPVLKEKAWAQ